MYSSKYLNKGKLDKLRAIDESVIVLKNKMSTFVYANIFELIDSSALAFANKHYKQYSSEYLNAWEIQCLFIEVCKLYKAAIDKQYKNMKFEVQKSINTTYYKKNTGKHKKGDVKDYWLVKRACSRHLNSLLRYLIKIPDFGSINNKDIKFQLDSYNEDKRSRILRFAKSRQEKAVSKLKLIVFKAGTYTKFGYTTSNKNTPCFFTDESNKKYKFCRNLCKLAQHRLHANWYIYKIQDKYVYIPLQVNGKYHKSCDVTRQCKVSVKGNRVFIYAPNQTDEPVFNDIGETLGVDVNVVNNLFSCSDGYVMDYDREYLRQMFKMLAKVDKIGYDNLSKNQLKKFRKIIRRNEWYFKRMIHELLMYCVQNNIVNIVLEDLRSFDGTYIKDKETGIKYSRIVRLLRLSNIKNWLKEQAEKLGIRVHLTPSHYTSQQCPVCGYIDRENRKTQEEFKCANCGHEDNADHNAAVNIKNRYAVNVLRFCLRRNSSSPLKGAEELHAKLHTFDDYSRMIPYTHNKFVIKRILGSECS